MLGVGTTTLVSHAAGRKDHAAGAAACSTSRRCCRCVTASLFLVVGMLALRTATRPLMGADAATARLADDYLLWFIPAMALQFALVAMGAALRGTATSSRGWSSRRRRSIINMVLAPFLIFGWGTGHAVRRRRRRDLVAHRDRRRHRVADGVFPHEESYLEFMFGGLEAASSTSGSECSRSGCRRRRVRADGGLHVVVYAMAVRSAPRRRPDSGSGMRIVQAGFMPVVALGFAVAPVAGQNFGARQRDRVSERSSDAALHGRRRDAALRGRSATSRRRRWSDVFSKDPTWSSRRRGVPAHHLAGTSSRRD